MIFTQGKKFAGIPIEQVPYEYLSNLYNDNVLYGDHKKYFESIKK
jgi:hypothetical protein